MGADAVASTTTPLWSTHGTVTTPGARAAPRLTGRPDRFSQWADLASRSLCGCPAIDRGRPPHPMGCSPVPVRGPVRSFKILFF
jgi:hypothetical protein